ncbi:hypothetical protein [Scatolibacter rhodanostii]|uniref:hypothetical protein n=1 Tax=Scatolibacter rhodanostii TaxID=2014781 RepID=UPI000C089C0D|nr:hypothetical protein [Scatolibacter rhodanostii]
MRVFSREKYVEDMKKHGLEPSKSAWVSECDGQPINAWGNVNSSIDGTLYISQPAWEIDKED